MQCTMQQRQAVLDQVTTRVGEVIADLIERQVQSEEVWTLKEKGAATLRVITEVGNELLSGLLRLHETSNVADTVPGPCGGQADYQRQREGVCRPLLAR